jgi:hypothetical protein
VTPDGGGDDGSLTSDASPPDGAAIDSPAESSQDGSGDAQPVDSSASEAGD